MIVDPKFTKAVDSSLITQTEKNTLKELSEKNLRWFVAQRGLDDDKKSHYFHDLGFPTSTDKFTSGSTLAKLFPELLQLNVDRIVLANIPASGFSESIDGRSIRVNYPVSGGTAPSSFSSVTIYSSTYTSDKLLKSESSILFGNNISFLFADKINRPYSGNTLNELQEVDSSASITTWAGTDANNFLTRPAAVQYAEVDQAVYGSDLRTDIKFAYPVPDNFPGDKAKPSSASTNQRVFSYSIPVGVAFLDKGIIAITHPQLVYAFPANSAFTSNDSLNTSTDIEDWKDLYFTGDTSTAEEAALIEYTDIDTAFKQVAVCLGMPKEFYISNNDTWNRSKALSQLNEQNGIISFDPVYITEVGLFNALGEEIALARMSEPILKEYTNLVSFVLEIDL